MVKKRLVDIQETFGEKADSLGRDITELNTTALHKIKSTKAIDAICNEVMIAVDTIILVCVNEGEIQNRKPRRQRYTPIVYNELQRIEEMARIRNIWKTDLWKKGNPPHGWVWHDNDPQRTLLGCMYQVSANQYQTLIRKEIADNPDGALILIRTMKKKLEKALEKDK